MKLDHWNFHGADASAAVAATVRSRAAIALQAGRAKVGATAEETTGNARANREFLERAVASISGCA